MARKLVGRISFVLCGPYSNTREYVRLDLVEVNGSSYICKKQCVGIPVTNTEYWMCIAKKGDSFTYSDLTSAQKIELAKDATEAATRAANSASSIQNLLNTLSQSTNPSDAVIAQVTKNTTTVNGVINRAVCAVDLEQEIDDLEVQYLSRLSAVEEKAGEIDDLALQVIEIDDEIRNTDKNGFYVTDGNGEIGFEVDEFGNSTSKGKVDGIGLGDNLKEEVLEEIESAIEDVRKEIPEELVETEENGFFVVDSNGKIGLKIKDNEFSAIGYNSKGMLELDSFGLQKYVDEDGNIIRLNKSASLVSLIHEWGFIGSSTSSGEAEYTVDGTTKFIELYDYSWGQRLCSLNGVIGYNFSKGGRTAKQWCTGTTERDWSGAQKTENLKFAYVIDLGMNDINEGQSVGTLADDVKTDYNDNSDTIAGWYFGIIQRLKSVVPNCYIFLLTAVNYMYKDSSLYAQNVIPMIRQIPSFAESFGYSRVYLIDSNKYGLKYDNALRSMLMSGGHPSSIGYQLEAFVANTLIDNVIRQNLSDFKETGFVIDGKHRQ